MALLAGGWVGSEALAQKTAPNPEQKPVKKPSETFDHVGRIVSIGADAKSIGIEIPPAMKGGEGTQMMFELDGKTTLEYWGVGSDGAKLTVGYRASVKLAKDSKGKAEKLVLVGGQQKKANPASITGRVLSATAGGKSITVEIPAKVKGDAATEQTVKLPATADVLFSGVGADEAKPTAEYHVAVWLKKGSADEAERATFQGTNGKAKGEPGSDLAGMIKAISADGKEITLESQPKIKGGSREEVKLTLTVKTTKVFNQVKAGQAKSAIGQRADVWLASGSKDQAEKVHFTAVPQKKVADSAIQGTLTGVSADGKKLELSVVTSKVKGVVETKEISVALTPETSVIYQGVGPDAAKPTKGYSAQVWLADGSKDRASLVILQATGKK
jgi:hypothetical protein